MLRIDPAYLRAAREATTAAELHELLLNAIRLEHATVPPYLAAAYSLQSATNRDIRLAIETIAIEEMLHMAIAANVLNAVGGRPQFDRPDFVPAFPSRLPMNVGNSVVVGIKKFSKTLVSDVFMKIEEPETPLHFPVTEAATEFATIGAFYRALIDKIRELGQAIFTGDLSRQVVAGAGFPSHKLFAVTDVETAVRALERIVKDGEGTTTLPLDDENELAHYYRFEEIFRGKRLVRDPSVPEGFSFKNAAFPFDEAGVADFPDDPKAADYAEGSAARQQVDDFNRLYSDLLRRLQIAFDGQPAAITQTLELMGDLRFAARQLMSTTDPNTERRLGPTFEFMPAVQSPQTLHPTGGNAMGFPQDLSNVVVFKIHPTIGVARVSLNDDYYVFGKDPGEYKSNGLIKRQAVQFRVFAYGENHVGLGELTPEVMQSLGITSVWSARVANRKIARLENTPLSGTEFVISAEASSDDANSGRLVGSLPEFEEGDAIPLGQIASTGLFIPPKGGAYRKQAGTSIPRYPALSTTIADTTCDGSVTVRLTRDGQELPVLPACIVVAPQDFSPDTTESSTLLDYFKEKLNIPTNVQPGNLHNETARTIDEAALSPGTQDFNPGFEVCLPDSHRSEVVDVESVCYRPAQDPTLDPREIRVRYKSPGDAGPGAVPGQLTSGLCSPWQGDFTDCVGYWSEHLPETAFLDEDSSVQIKVFRKEYSDHSPGARQLNRSNGDEFERHVDKVGIIRLRNSKKTETERDLGDDIT